MKLMFEIPEACKCQADGQSQVGQTCKPLARTLTNDGASTQTNISFKLCIFMNT